MFMEWMATPVPLWLLLVISLFLFVIGIAVNRKFSVTSGWLAVLGTLFTPDDIKTLAVLIWRAGLVPASLRDVRFGGKEEQFANYFADMVLKLLPEVSKIEKVIDGMTGKPQQNMMSREMAPVGIYEQTLNLEGRGHVKFLGPPERGRDRLPGWPIIEKPVAPPVDIDPQN